MVDRRLAGDIAFAVMIALPTASFVRPGPATPTISVVKISSAEPGVLTVTGSNDRRIGLLG